MKPKINVKSLLGILFAIGAGVAAFVTEMDNQRKDVKIADMENRILNLEQREAE